MGPSGIHKWISKGLATPCNSMQNVVGMCVKYISLDGGPSLHYKVPDPQSHGYRKTPGSESQNKIEGFP